MKTSIEFEEDEKRESESNWHMGLTSTPSFDTIGSKAILQQHNLRILRKNEPSSGRQIIPGTLNEKLSYYRSFASSPSKTQIVSMQQVLFNKYLWFYVFNVFCKSLPSTYVYVFLSSYAADEHFFVSKMIPLLYGYIWYSVACGYFSIINLCGYVALLWDYVVSGLLYKNPWNRCEQTYNIETNPTCYEVIDFTKKIQNKSLVFQIYGYTIKDAKPEEYEIFQMAPLLFLKSRMVLYSFKPSYFWMLESLVFVGACVFYRQLFKKYIWKVLYYVQCAIILMYFAAFCHLVSFYFVNGFKKVAEPVDDIAIELWNADVDVLAESMSSPPIVHILSSRGTEKPKPSRDSTIIVASNAMYYIFRGLLAYMMKRYCEHVIGTTLLFTELNPCSSFFFWPIYLSYFYLGDYCTIIYFLLNGIEEFLVMAITLYCLIESISCEWHWMKPWHIALVFSVLAVIVTSVTSVNQRSIIFVYMTLLSTLAEVIVVFCLYPLGRLVEDITFHCGARPTTLRVWNLRIVPIFYIVKVSTLLNGFLNILSVLGIEQKLSPFGVQALYFQGIPFILGSFYAIYDIVYRKKEGCKQLVIPVPEWGPKDPKIRRLRHQYDSREYIGSQAPRKLSRYFMEKAELTTYQVDVQYENYNRHRDLRDFQYDLNFEDEMSN